MTAVLILQAIVFAIWAVTAFRILFHLLKRGQARTGHPFPGPITFLAVVKDWISDPAEAKWRHDLLGLTIALICLSVTFAMMSR